MYTQLTLNRKYCFKNNSLIIDNDNKQYLLQIKDTENENPRDRLLKYGAPNLPSTDLLAIILKTEKNFNTVSKIFREYGEKTLINQTDPEKLKKELKISIGKACQIVACFELGRRFFKKDQRKRPIIRTSKGAFEYLKDMRDLPKEQLRGIYLNSRYKVIHDEIISLGSLTANIVHPREVFAPAIEYSAVAVILAHNHPSGCTKPSDSDIETTDQIIKAGKILGIDVLDHIIVTENKFTSIPLNYN